MPSPGQFVYAVAYGPGTSEVQEALPLGLPLVMQALTSYQPAWAGVEARTKAIAVSVLRRRARDMGGS
jgi:hypothetical protein